MRRIIFLFLIISMLSGQVLAKPVVNVYSFRKAELISPLITAFEIEHAVKVNLVYGKPNALLSKLANEQINSPVDVLLTSELSQLQSYKHLLQPLANSNTAIAPTLIDEKRHWVAVSLRIRALFTRKTDTHHSLVNYSQLANSDLASQFCNRDFTHSYNQQMAKSLKAIGSKQDTNWLDNPRSLLKKRPSGGDRDQLRFLYRQQCNYALANHYYYAMLLNSKNPLDRAVANHLEMHFLQTQSGVTPVSATAAAISKNAPNEQNAQLFVNFLLSLEAQKLVTTELHEFAVLPTIRKTQLTNYPNLKLSLESVKKAL
jgi:iron(III) transport system substrate-binding protein